MLDERVSPLADELEELDQDSDKEEGEAERNGSDGERSLGRDEGDD
jgi:pre-mRNA-splicing factor 38A